MPLPVLPMPDRPPLRCTASTVSQLLRGPVVSRAALVGQPITEAHGEHDARRRPDVVWAEFLEVQNNDFPCNSHERRRHDDADMEHILAQVQDDIDKDFEAMSTAMKAPKVARISLIVRINRGGAIVFWYSVQATSMTPKRITSVISTARTRTARRMTACKMRMRGSCGRGLFSILAFPCQRQPETV